MKSVEFNTLNGSIKFAEIGGDVVITVVDHGVTAEHTLKEEDINEVADIFHEVANLDNFRLTNFGFVDTVIGAELDVNIEFDDKTGDPLYNIWLKSGKNFACADNFTASEYGEFVEFLEESRYPEAA